MGYRSDMSEEERKRRQNEAAAKSRAKQKERMAVDPEYAAEVKAKRAAWDKTYYEQEDPEERNAYMRAWHAKKVEEEDPEYLKRKRESGRKHYQNNKDSRLAYYREWAEDNDRSEYNLEWARANPDKRRESSRRRKALIKGADTIEIFSKNEIWERDKGICGICNEPADPMDWHLDHVIPLSKGGQHTLANVQVSHPKCNLSKKDKMPTEVF